MTTMTERHPTGLTMAQVDGETVRLIHCPECGQIEIWTEAEVHDHGMCRALGWCTECELRNEQR